MGVHSWVSVRGTPLRGCYDYKTTIEIYVDSIGPVGSGVNIGKVGVTSSGQKIYRYKIGPWSSGSKRICA